MMLRIVLFLLLSSTETFAFAPMSHIQKRTTVGMPQKLLQKAKYTAHGQSGGFTGLPVSSFGDGEETHFLRETQSKDKSDDVSKRGAVSEWLSLWMTAISAFAILVLTTGYYDRLDLAPIHVQYVFWVLIFWVLNFPNKQADTMKVPNMAPAKTVGFVAPFLMLLVMHVIMMNVVVLEPNFWY